jgi:DNA-directed RNA polymerase specialized sigma24 family protein
MNAMMSTNDTPKLVEIQSRLVRAQRRLAMLREIAARSPEQPSQRLRLELDEAERRYHLVRKEYDECRALIASD